MDKQATTTHAFDFPPRLLSWMGWSLMGLVFGLILKSMDFMLPEREAWLEQLAMGQFGSETVVVTPYWLLFLILLMGLLLLCGVITYAGKPFRTLPLLLASLVLIGFATPVLGLWGIHFFAPALLAALTISCTGAWITSFFLKTPEESLPTVSLDEIIATEKAKMSDEQQASDANHSHTKE